ncbi:MAG: class I SAM-dependent methyltransferase [Pseudomonadales bacterium]|nr:class I SAM-dependent methyltransferase [Pseudomonadales bacterium]
MDFYTRNAQALITQYQSLNPEQVHSTWLKHLPKTPSLALDIGAGSGRDALWLAEKGWLVTAIEPNKALRQSIPQHPCIQTLNDHLPFLPDAPRQQYQLILVSAVWMHLTQPQQQQALIRLQKLLSPKGMIIITWRNQADEQDRQFELVDESLFQDLQPALNAEIIETEDQGGREGVKWKCAVIKNEAFKTEAESI